MNEGVIDGDWEYRPLRLPPGISRRTATTQLAIHAEFAGWELSRTLLLRRRFPQDLVAPQAHPAVLPGLIT